MSIEESISSSNFQDINEHYKLGQH